MNGFNSIYYAVSSIISDTQIKYPMLNNVVKILITPGIYALNIMSYADPTDAFVLVFGTLSRCNWPHMPAFHMVCIMLNARFRLA